MRTLLAFIMAMTVAASALAADYAITVSDKLAISVLGEQDLSASVLVRPDGKITIPHSGEIVAAGYTPTQLADRIAQSLKALVKKPVVTVTVLEGQNDKVYAIGGGVKPGVFELSRHKSLLQVLASMDLSLADLDQASLVRANQVVARGFRELYEDGDISRNQELESGDVIILPVLRDRYVYVSGAVAAPKTLPYRDGMTVLDALMEAGGFNKFASKNDTKVVRRNGEKEEIIRVKAKRLMERGDSSQNVTLRRGDMVIVEEGFF